jgi:hypothetical protein
MLLLVTETVLASLCENRKSLDIISLPVKNVGHEVDPMGGQAHP